MAFFVELTEAISRHKSLLVPGLNPNPELLASWAAERGLAGRSLMRQACHWIKAVVKATAPVVCAFKPSLGSYQALVGSGPHPPRPALQPAGASAAGSGRPVSICRPARLRFQR